jgi:hypothetical protein
MPQIKQIARDVIDLDLSQVKSVGDMCYAYTKVLIDEFNNEPRWATIHRLRAELYDPPVTSKLYTVEQIMSTKFTLLDRRTARDLAFLEFYRRVGAVYEDNRASENGDLFERIKVIP